MKPEGRYEQYRRYSDPVPLAQGNFFIQKKWTAEDGSTMYWIKKTGGTGLKYELARISSDGTSYEIAFRRNNRPYPSERDMNTGNSKYSIFYRE
jgi:hypothetical protein